MRDLYLEYNNGFVVIYLTGDCVDEICVELFQNKLIGVFVCKGKEGGIDKIGHKVVNVEAG